MNFCSNSSRLKITDIRFAEDMKKYASHILNVQGGSVTADMVKHQKSYQIVTTAHPHTGIHLTEKGLDYLENYIKEVREAFGLMVEAEGRKLYFSGDTLCNEKLFQLSAHRPDITFICINGRLGNMNAEEALKVAKAIGAKVNIPSHYHMFASNSEDPHLFADCIDSGRILEFNKNYSLQDLLEKE